MYNLLEVFTVSNHANYSGTLYYHVMHSFVNGEHILTNGEGVEVLKVKAEQTTFRKYRPVTNGNTTVWGNV